MSLIKLEVQTKSQCSPILQYQGINLKYVKEVRLLGKVFSFRCYVRLPRGETDSKSL